MSLGLLVGGCGRHFTEVKMAIREFKYRGKTVEELKKMDIKDFIHLVPSRQKRSLKRGFTEQQKKLLFSTSFV